MTVGELLRTLEQTASIERMDAANGARLDLPATRVTHDSREAREGAVFVAIRGSSADGILFAPQAIAAGAAAVVADRAPSGRAGVPWLVVPDTRAALAQLAAAFYGHPSRALQVVGVTGTNGKTTTTFLLQSIFSAAGVKCGMLGTVGYSVGGGRIPATHTTPEAPDLQRLLGEMVSTGCGACAMEVSSHALALHRVDGIRFAAAVFTNLTRDHLDFHTDMEDYFAAKRRLFEMLAPEAPAVVNVDDPRGAALVGAGGRPVTYGIASDADVRPHDISFSMSGLQGEVRTPQGTVKVASRLVGRPNAYNVLAAVAATSALGVSVGAIEAGLRDLAGVPGRFEVVSAPHDDITVVVDYAHTDDALRNLLETARPLAARRLITVFGAGGDRDRTKRPLMGMVAARLSDLVILTSDNPRGEDPARILEEVRLGAAAEVRTSGAELLEVVDRRQAIGEAIERAQAGDVVLIAGKGHEKYQEIGGTRFPFDDVVVAQEALEARRVKSRVG